MRVVRLAREGEGELERSCKLVTAGGLSLVRTCLSALGQKRTSITSWPLKSLQMRDEIFTIYAI